MLRRHCPACHDVFDPHIDGQRYCSPQCRELGQQLRKREEKPPGRGGPPAGNRRVEGLDWLNSNTTNSRFSPTRPPYLAFHKQALKIRSVAERFNAAAAAWEKVAADTHDRTAGSRRRP